MNADFEIVVLIRIEVALVELPGLHTGEKGGHRQIL